MLDEEAFGIPAGPVPGGAGTRIVLNSDARVERESAEVFTNAREWDGRAELEWCLRVGDLR